MKKMLTIIILAAIAVMAAFLLMKGDSNSVDDYSKLSTSQREKQLIVFETNRGNITLELNGKKSPKTVNNFIEYIKAGFYDDTIFHRAIPGVIIQGGGFKSDLVAKETRSSIENESSNGLLNVKGSISMARKSAENSATSQFFINLRNNPKLDYSKDKEGYAVFGKVIKGLTLLETAAKSETKKQGAHQNVPKEEFKIISVKLIEEPKLKEITTSTEETSDKAKNDGFQEGIHYVLLKEPLSLLNTNKVEVIAAFSFGCGHCYGLYPSTQEWATSKNKDIEFSYFHAVWNPSMKLYAQTYYTAIELGIENKIHLPLFEAIVINQQKLSNKAELAAFFESFGVPKDKFTEVFDSESISKRVTQAEGLTKAFNLASVPEFIVAGKYRVDPMRAGGPKEIFDVIDFLVQKERKLR